jgi:hypothetical protein
VDGSGVAHIVWSDHRHVDTEIYYASYLELTPVDEARLSGASGPSTVPTVAAGVGGEVHVVWCDLRNGTADLYYRSAEDQSGFAVTDSWAAGNGGIALRPPYPNPSAKGVRIDFALRRGAHASVKVFDVEGRLVDVVADGLFDAGVHATAWDGMTRTGNRAAAGIYFIQARGAAGEDVKLVVIAR